MAGVAFPKLLVLGGAAAGERRGEAARLEAGDQLACVQVLQCERGFAALILHNYGERTHAERPLTLTVEVHASIQRSLFAAVLQALLAAPRVSHHSISTCKFAITIPTLEATTNGAEGVVGDRVL